MLADGRLHLNVQGRKQNSWDWGYFFWLRVGERNCVWHHLSPAFEWIQLVGLHLCGCHIWLLFWRPLLIPILCEIQESTLIQRKGLNSFFPSLGDAQRFFWALWLAWILVCNPKVSLVGLGGLSQCYHQTSVFQQKVVLVCNLAQEVGLKKGLWWGSAWVAMTCCNIMRRSWG
jgi:hypothetical protein